MAPLHIFTRGFAGPRLCLRRTTLRTQSRQTTRRFSTTVPKTPEKTHFRTSLPVIILGAGIVAATFRWTALKKQKDLEAEGLSRDAILDLLAAQPGLVVDGAGAPVDVRSALKEKTLALYFSAMWCPPCRQFTPMLRNFYQTANAQSKSLEVVFVSCDASPEQHAQYMHAMHDLWLTVPYQHQDLLKALKTRCHCWAGSKDAEELGTKDRQYGIPCLILFNPDGRFDPEGVTFVQTWYMGRKRENVHG